MLNEFVAEIGKNNIAVYVLQMCTLPLDHPSEFVWNGNSIQSNLQKGEHTEIVRNFIAATALITGSHL
jgi:hypothetical protein